MFTNIRLSIRIWLPILALMIAMIGLSIFYLNTIRDKVYNARTEQVQTAAESAHSVVNMYYKQFQAGKLTEAEAKDLARDAMRAVRYEGNEYIFAYNDSGVNVAHGMRKGLEGKNLWKLQDANGKNLIQDLVKTAQSGGGMVKYGWKQSPTAPIKDKLAYALYFQPWGWTIGTGVYIDDIQSAILSNIKAAVGVLAIALLISGSLAIAVIRSVTKSLSTTISEMKNIADGDLKQTVSGTNDPNELGDIARALLVFRDTAQDREISRQHEHKAETERLKRIEHVEVICNDFDAAARDVITTLHQSLSEMQSAAQTLSTSTQEAGSCVSAAAEAAQQAADNVQSVAAATEELFASMDEINNRTQNSERIAHSAKEQAAKADTTMLSLGDTTRSIGSVLDLINDIASQTNLLALNATIEAARAGDAGKGFAVVANEVKNLANQTSHATGQISEQITAVQQQTQSASELISNVSHVIEELSISSTDIGAAVEQQRSATHEISRNVHEASKGTDDVTSNVHSVITASESVATAGREIDEAALTLDRAAQALDQVVSRFLIDVRAA